MLFDYLASDGPRTPAAILSTPGHTRSGSSSSLRGGVGSGATATESTSATLTPATAPRSANAAPVVVPLAGSPGVVGTADGLGASALFNRPAHLAMHPVTGDVFVTEYSNHSIRVSADCGPAAASSCRAGLHV